MPFSKLGWNVPTFLLLYNFASFSQGVQSNKMYRSNEKFSLLDRYIFAKTESKPRPSSGRVHDPNTIDFSEKS